MSPSPSPSSTKAGLTPEEIEQEQLRKYRSFYNSEKLDYSRHASSDYFSKFARLRLAWIRQRYQGGTVLDLCCGSGEYLLPVAQFAEKTVGIDFSPELVEVARQKVEENGLKNVTLHVANAKAMPLADNSIDLLFSFASLYHIPKVEDVIRECGRVLTPGGQAILEFGISHSLNTVVCHAYPEAATPCHVSLDELRRMIRQSGLSLVTDRGYQVLPLWGNKPKWLRPLLNPAWKKIMALEIGGHMLDEYLCSLWPISRFAFRRILICRK